MPPPQHLKYITRVVRNVYHREKCIENHSMKQCWDENDWIMPSKYVPSVPNVPAGYKAFWRYDKPEIPIPPRVARLSKIWTQRHFQQFMGGARVFPSSLVLKEMDMTTSCGYPWNLTHQNKEQMCGDVPMFQVIKDYSALIRTDYPCGISPIWTCSVKGKEMRPVEKIQQNNLRSFTAAPFEHSHATNELCLDMNDRFYRSAGRTWSQVGATKFDGQWNAMFTRLNKHRNAAAVDGKQFDASLLASLLWDQMWIRWEMLEPEYRTFETLLAFMNIYDAIIYAFVVLDRGDLLRKLLGNPSGSSNTVVDNTMVLFRLICISWIELSDEYRADYQQKCRLANLPLTDVNKFYVNEEEIDSYGYQTMMDNVEAALYGDDDTFTVSDFVREWFTPRRIAEVWTKYGLVTTAEYWDYTQLELLDFLSQSFVYITGLWMPSPETEKVLGSLYLGSSVDDIRFHMLRAYALRIESWANAECRQKIETYINFVHTHYADQLHGEIRGLQWADIRQVWKTDAQILRLYSGEESRSDLLQLYDSPAWRLVCVELNPGPLTSMHLNIDSLFKTLSLLNLFLLCYDRILSGITVMSSQAKKQNKGKKVWKKKETTTVNVNPAAAKPAPKPAPAVQVNVSAPKVAPPKGKKKGNHVPKHVGMDPVVVNAAKAWIMHLGDPFNYAPISIGGSGTPNYIWGSYAFAGSITNLASATDFVAGLLPSCVANSSGTSPWFSYQSTGAGVTWSNGVGNYWANGGSAGSVMGTARPISAALRVTIKFNQNGVPPQMYGGQFPSANAFATATFFTNPSSLYLSPSNVKGGPNTTSMQACWVPQDITDISAFTSAILTGALGGTTMPYVGATEMAASYTYTISVEAIAFFEFQPVSGSQLQFFLPNTQAPYSVTQMWEAYLRLTNSKEFQVRRVIENPRTRGHKHGSKFGLGTRGALDSKLESIGHAVNPIPNMPAQVGGVEPEFGSSTLGTITTPAVMGAVAVAAQAVKAFNSHAMNDYRAAHSWVGPDVAAVCVGCGQTSAHGLCDICRNLLNSARTEVKVEEPESPELVSLASDANTADLSQSTHDLASTLFSKILKTRAVTSKTASLPAQ